MQDVIYDESSSKVTEPSLKISKIIAKISNIMKKEKVKFTPERVRSCCKAMRDQLAMGKRVTIKKESLELYNKNSDSAPDSPELSKSKEDLRKALMLENRKIVTLSQELLKKGKIESKIQKYIADFFK